MFNILIINYNNELNNIENFHIKTFIKPFNYVGGDYFDIIKLNNNKFIITIGDITGHGLDAGLYQIIVHSIIRTLTLIYKDSFDAEKTLIFLNDVLLWYNRDLKNDSKIMSLFILNITDNIEVTGSHEKILIFNMNSNSFLEINTINELYFGLIDDIEKHIKTLKFNLENNNIIILYTDGLINIWDNEKKDILGLEYLKEYIIKLEPKSINDLDIVLRKYIDDNDKNKKIIDDIAYILLCRKNDNVKN